MKNKNEIDREIRKTLRVVFEYIGVNTDHADNAQVRTYVERLIEKIGGSR